MIFSSTTHRTPIARAITASVLSLALLTWAGCDTVGSSTDPADSNNGPDATLEPVTVGFGMAGSETKSKASDEDTLTIAGEVGTLAITDIRLIVSEMKLKVDDDTSGEGPEFTTPPSLLDLPLNSAQIAAAAEADIPEDTYDEFEFEVEDVDPNDEDLSAEQRQHLETLLDSIRVDYPSWPENASMVAAGTYTPTGGDPISFTTYFEAEIEIEVPLDPPLEVTADGLPRAITVRIDPAQWLQRADGTVWNLAEFDYNMTQQLFELEAEFEDGIAEIETSTEEADND